MAFKRAAAAVRRLWSSVAFRLTLNYSLLAVCTTVFLLIFAYGRIVDLMQVQFSRQVVLAANRLTVHYDTLGLAALQTEITQLLSDQTDIDSEMYLLLAPDGRRLVGNLDFLPGTANAPTGAGPADNRPPVLMEVLREGSPATGFLTLRKLSDGSVLVVGRDTVEMQEIKSLIGRAVVAATLVALFLVLIGTTIFRRELRLRVEAIRSTALRVGTGELTRRIPDADAVDEFAQLRQDINQMLDRIESLMTGVRNVSDSIAHNLRTPLARALARLHKAQAGRQDPATLSAAIDYASDELMNLISVSEKLLLIAEAESGVRRQSFEAIALEQVIQDVVELYEPLAAEQGVVLDCATTILDSAAGSVAHPANMWVDADADLLAGALANLVDNALKYAGSGRSIHIRLSRHGAMARVVLQDRGPGVAAEHLHHLGSRFYRVSPDLPGFGLGLASVRAVITLHGGTVRFEDAAPGLRVVIELPAGRPPAPAQPPSK